MGVLLDPFRFGSATPYRDEILLDTPLAWYRLGEASGTTMTDSSGNGRSGVYTGVTLGVAGALVSESTQTAASLSALTTSHADVTPLADWMKTVGAGALMVDHSIEFWIKVASNPVSSTQLLGRDNSSNAPWVAFLTTAGKVGYWTRRVTGFSGVNATTMSVCDGLWHHVVCTYETATAAQSVYIDGVLDSSVAHGGTATENTGPVVIGGASGVAPGRLAGSLDEIAFYGSALSASRVLAHYSSGISNT